MLGREVEEREELLLLSRERLGRLRVLGPVLGLEALELALGCVLRLSVGYYAAVRLNDRDEVLLWADRRVQAVPDLADRVAIELTSSALTRTDGVERIEAPLRTTLPRPLEVDATVHATDEAERRVPLFVALANARRADGQLEGAREALLLAGEHAWRPSELSAISESLEGAGAHAEARQFTELLGQPERVVAAFSPHRFDGPVVVDLSELEDVFVLAYMDPFPGPHRLLLEQLQAPAPVNVALVLPQPASGLALVTYHDPEREAHRAFDVWGVQKLVVVAGDRWYQAESREDAVHLALALETTR